MVFCFVLVLMTVWMLLPGVRAETSTRVAGGPQGFESDGLRGLKALGVRELSYRLAFLACNVAPTNPRVRSARLKMQTATNLAVWLQMCAVFITVWR